MTWATPCDLCVGKLRRAHAMASTMTLAERHAVAWIPLGLYTAKGLPEHIARQHLETAGLVAARGSP